MARHEKYILIAVLFRHDLAKVLWYYFTIHSRRPTKLSNMWSAKLFHRGRYQSGFVCRRSRHCKVPFTSRIAMIYICRLSKQEWLEIKNTYQSTVSFGRIKRKCLFGELFLTCELNHPVNVAFVFCIFPIAWRHSVCLPCHLRCLFGGLMFEVWVVEGSPSFLICVFLTNFIEVDTNRVLFGASVHIANCHLGHTYH